LLGKVLRKERGRKRICLRRRGEEKTVERLSYREGKRKEKVTEKRVCCSLSQKKKV